MFRNRTEAYARENGNPRKVTRIRGSNFLISLYYYLRKQVRAGEPLPQRVLLCTTGSLLDAAAQDPAQTCRMSLRFHTISWWFICPVQFEKHWSSSLGAGVHCWNEEVKWEDSPGTWGHRGSSMTSAHHSRSFTLFTCL